MHQKTDPNAMAAKSIKMKRKRKYYVSTKRKKNEKKLLRW